MLVIAEVPLYQGTEQETGLNIHINQQGLNLMEVWLVQYQTIKKIPNFQEFYINIVIMDNQIVNIFSKLPKLNILIKIFIKILKKLKKKK